MASTKQTTVIAKARSPGCESPSKRCALCSVFGLEAISYITSGLLHPAKFAGFAMTSQLSMRKHNKKVSVVLSDDLDGALLAVHAQPRAGWNVLDGDMVHAGDLGDNAAHGDDRLALGVDNRRRG